MISQKKKQSCLKNIAKARLVRRNKSKATRVARFWKRVSVKKENECWLWDHPSANGYGSTFWNGKKISSHRMAFVLSKGRMPVKNLLHICDIPLCCNPSHLKEGTQKENLEDAARKGRMERGENRYNAKLTEDNVREIRRRYTPRNRQHSLSKLGRDFGVHAETVQSVIKGITWKHVDNV